MAALAVPGPRGSWLLGLTPELRRDPLGTFERVMLAHRVVGRIPLGAVGRRIRLHLVSDPDGAREVLTTNAREHTKDTPFYREIAAYVGNGLLTSDGATWRQQRRTLAPLFTPRRIATYVDDMAAEADRVATRWASSAQAGSPVDLHAEMTGYTLRVVARILFGTAVDTAIPAVREISRCSTRTCGDRALNPVTLPRRLPTPAQRRATRAQRALYDVVDAIIRERQRDGAGAHGEDLVSLLLAARDPETGDPLTATEVRDQVADLPPGRPRDDVDGVDVRVPPARPPPGRPGPGAAGGVRRPR